MTLPFQAARLSQNQLGHATQDDEAKAFVRLEKMWRTVPRTQNLRYEVLSDPNTLEASQIKALLTWLVLLLHASSLLHTWNLHGHIPQPGQATSVLRSR